jgi:hypothetical protein
MRTTAPAPASSKITASPFSIRRKRGSPSDVRSNRQPLGQWLLRNST